MATAQVLRVTHTIDDRVRVVEDRVLDVDDRVAGIEDRVAGVDDRVVSVDDNVKAVDDKVAVVIDGAQPSLVSHQGNIFNSDVPRGERDKDSHTTNGRRHESRETSVIFFLR
jgi:archaellum component FlaC